MTRRGLAMLAVVAAAALAAPAFGAEVRVGVGMVAGSGSGADEMQLQQVPQATGKADLVAVVKVTEVADPKADAEEKKKEEAAPAPQPAPQPAMVVFGGMATTPKIVTAEVTELLKGDKEVKTVKFSVPVMKQGNKEMMLVTRTVDQMAGNARFRRSFQQWVPFELAKDKPALVFLKKTGEKKDADGKVVEREWAVEGPLFGTAPEKATAAARDALKKIAEWDNPPKLSAEDQAAVKQLIADLGSDDFATREAATKALVAKGGGVKPLVEEALKASKDPEIKQRAEKVIEDLKPEAVKTGDPNAAGDFNKGVIFGAGGGAVQFQMQAGD